MRFLIKKLKSSVTKSSHTSSLLALLCFVYLATLSGELFAAIDVNKSFSPATTYPTQISTATIVLQNSSLTPIINTRFTDNFPNDVFIAALSNATTDCGGLITTSNSATGGEVTLSGGTIPASDGINPGTCSVTVDVQSNVKGTYINRIEIGEVTGENAGLVVSNTQVSKGTLAVIVQDITGSINYSLENGFSGYVQGDEIVRTTITINNPNPVPLSGLRFTDDLYKYAYNVRAIDGTQSSTCGATVTIIDRPARTGSYGTTSRVDVTDGVIPANGSCEVSFDIEPSRSLTRAYLGSTLVNTIPVSSITTNEGTTNFTAISKRIGAYTGIRIHKSMSPATINILNASTTRVNITFNNSNTYDISNINFTDTMPTLAPAAGAMTVQSIDSNTCGGTVSHNGTAFTLSGGTLVGAGKDLSGVQSGSCRISASVTVDAAGSYVNNIPSSNLGGHQYVGVTATLEAVADAFSVTKRISNSPYQGDESILTYTYTNNTDARRGVDVTNLDLTDSFITNCSGSFCPATPFRVSSASTPTTTCSSASIIAPVDATTVSINDVVLEKGSNCNVTIPVVFRADAFPVDKHVDPIPIGDITYQLNGAGDTFIYPLIPVAEFNIFPALVISKSFSPDEVGPFGVTRLKITPFHRSRSRYPIEALGFTDVLPSGHVIATPANLVNECGGTLTAIEGSNTIQLSDVVLVSTNTSVSKSCNIYIDIRVPALTSGSRQTATNTIPGNAHQAASLNVSALKTGEVAPFNQLENYTSATAQISRKATHVTANKEFLPALINGGGVSRVRITISNLLASAIDLTEAGLTDDFSDTNMRLHTTINPRFTDSNGSTSGKCRLGTFTGASGEQSITLSDAEVDAGAICYMEFNVTASQGGNHINAIDANDWVSREGVTNNNNVAATLTVGRQVNVGKGFSPNVIPEGGTSVLTLEFFNTNEIPNNETGASPALIDEMPTGISLLSIDENTCGGTTSIGSQNGNDTLQLDDGTFVAGDVCHIKATVTGATPGLYTNTIPVGALRMDSGTDNPDPAEASILITAKPTVTKEFVTPVIGVGGTSKVRLTLSNPNDGNILASGLTGVSLTDTLVNMTIAANPAITGTCADIATTAVSGATTFTLTNATVPPQGSCTVEFNVTSTVLGAHNNQTSGALSDQTDAAGSPSNVAVLTVLEQVTHTKTFVPDLIHIDGTSRMKVVLTNTNAQEVALNAFFALFDFFPRTPDSMEVADIPDLTNTCGATVLSSFGGAGFNSGGQLLLVRGGAVPANSSCEISFNVKVNGAGTYTNTTNGLSTELGYDPGASDDLVVHTGFPISGRVYHDSNMDGNNDATEKGINALPVVLFNRDNNSCISTRTDADGNYRFSNIAPGNYQLYEASRETVPTPQNCDINTTKDPATYRSTTANVFTPFVMAHEAITGKDFGDVTNPTFTPNHSGSILPDNVIFYAHQFTAKSTGNVTMRVNSSGNATTGWSSVLYQDSNCNGQLDGVEANSVLSGAIPTIAEQDICILNKVYAPANVSDGETINHEITAEFDFNNNAFAGTITLTVTDVTKAAANEVIDTEPEQTQGSSRLELRKTVENVTQGTAETDTQNQAKPNDVLRYRIYYHNSGTGVITDLKINDVIPTFTRIIAAPSCDLPLPDSLTRCDGIVIDDNNIEWYFGNGDVLKGGGEGVVRYDVIID